VVKLLQQSVQGWPSNSITADTTFHLLPKTACLLQTGLSNVLAKQLLMTSLLLEFALY